MTGSHDVVAETRLLSRWNAISFGCSHRVRLKNDVTEKTVTVTVASGKTTVIDQTW